MGASKIKVFGLLVALMSLCRVNAQELNYNQINIQGQLFETALSETDFEFLVVGIAGDTIWRESHSAVALTEQGAFTLPFGAGSFIQGTVSNFYDINWLVVNEVELYHSGTDRYLQGSYNVQAVPYAMHSLNVIQSPSTKAIHDLEDVDYEVNQIIKFDGTNYLLESDGISDTALFAWYADSVRYSDTAWVAYFDGVADTAWFAYFTDSAMYALNLDTVIYADSAITVDSASYALSSTGNWSIFGDSTLTEDNFIGPTIEESMVLRTNNTPRFVFDAESSTHANFPGPGFRFNTNRGALFTLNTDPGVDEIPGTYFYLDGASTSLHGGSSIDAIDTLKGMYSFAWGENVGTNGTYSTVFGKNTYGDTAIFGVDTPYPSISSFAMGRDCRVAHMSVAIGDSAIANYYRNVAIGKNVIANTASAGTAIGNNVLVIGATSWAMGHNVTASGHFSTVMGSNASTDSRVGSFVYGDNSTTDTVVNTANHQFMARADGGYVFYSSTDLTMGVELLPGAGSWSMISDRSKKQNINLLAGKDYQLSFDKLQVSSWNYIGNSVAHIGPMAQDIYGIFQVGEKPYYINMIDSDGITFLGVKMLVDRLGDVPTEDELKELNKEIDNEKLEIEKIENRINELYEELDHN